MGPECNVKFYITAVGTANSCRNFNFSSSYKELRVEHATQRLRQQMQGLASHQTLPTVNTFEYPFNLTPKVP